MKTSSLVVLIVFLTFVSCGKTVVKSDFQQSSNSNLVIKAGFTCGWGSGDESIEISKTSIKYIYSVPAKSQQPLINKTRSVPNSEWSEILNDVNIDTFFKLNYQTCNVCFDGCDEWIIIISNNISHEIRFTKGLKIDSISKIQNKLSQLRKEFNN